MAKLAISEIHATCIAVVRSQMTSNIHKQMCKHEHIARQTRQKAGKNALGVTLWSELESNNSAIINVHPFIIVW